MILDGNSPVSNPKVYVTKKEMELEAEIEKLKAEIDQLKSSLFHHTGEMEIV